jgi:hypothetical protein
VCRHVPGIWVVQKLTGENLKVIWAKFSSLILAVLVSSVIAWYRQARPHLELKTWPRFCPVSLSFSVIYFCMY